MDARISLEAGRVDPSVPFRATPGHCHKNWAQTFHSRPELYIQPESVDEIRKVVTLARKCRRRLVIVGAGYSLSDIICTSSWMISLEKYNKLLSIEPYKLARVQGGIRLRDLQAELKKEHGLSLPILSTIDDQSIAGAIATGTHGSSTRHGLISDAVVEFSIMLSDSSVVSCNLDQNKDLFRAGLVSLGALGIIIQVIIRAVPVYNLTWKQDLLPFDTILRACGQGVWYEREFVRIDWYPYSKKCVKWVANRTGLDVEPSKRTMQRSALGIRAYHSALYASNWVPCLLPWIEKFAVMLRQRTPRICGVSEGYSAQLVDHHCSSFYNEWAIPLSKGPEALLRLSAWLHGDIKASGIPFNPKGVWVNAPIELRVANARRDEHFRAFLNRPHLDFLTWREPSLLLNATLYRPYGVDPRCHRRYYEAFQWLMRRLGGRPHFASNFQDLIGKDMAQLFPQLSDWFLVREEVDPFGMFFGNWHRRTLLGGADDDTIFPLEEQEWRTEQVPGGGLLWHGSVRGCPSDGELKWDDSDIRAVSRPNKRFVECYEVKPMID